MVYDIDVIVDVGKGIRPSRPDGIDENLWKIAEDCWKHEPRSRPAMLEVMASLRKIQHSP